jgi:hypothetical protein
LNVAPYIEFRLHRTGLVFVRVQNRYLEQVVIVTGKLSASPFWILDSAKTLSWRKLEQGVDYSSTGLLAVVPACACDVLIMREELPPSKAPIALFRSASQ